MYLKERIWYYDIYMLCNECVQIFMLCVALCQTYNSVKLCILYCYFVHVLFCLCFMYKFITFFFFPPWDQYADSIVPLAYVPVWCCVCSFVKSDLTVNYLSYFISTYAVTYANHTFGGHWLVINRTDIWHKIRLDQATRKEWWASENVLWQDFFTMYRTLHIDSYLFDNLMHFKYYIECV